MNENDIYVDHIYLSIYIIIIIIIIIIIEDSTLLHATNTMKRKAKNFFLRETP